VAEYIDKSGETALRGIHRTGKLDDDGLPAFAWYGAKVDTLTAKAIIVAMLDALDWRSLDKAEQSMLLSVMVRDMKPFQRNAVRRIVRGYR
jgi:hypothetical protein